MTQNNFKKLEDLFDSNDRFIICGHENPDPDSICSCIAMEHLLSELGKEVYCINSDPVPSNLLDLDYKNVIHSLASGDKIPDNCEEYILIIMDTESITNIGNIYNLIGKVVKSIFIIDHHASTENKAVKDFFVNGDASSVCEMMYGIFQHFNIEIPKEVGDALFTGILFDTGSFHYPKTSAYTFYVAEKIVKNGTRPSNLYPKLYEQESVEYLRILSFVLSTLTLYYSNQIAVLKMPRKMLIESGAKYDECSSIINIPLRSKHIKAVIFCKENLEGVKRISMRSKGNINVVKIATTYNGGGHKNAAGFKLTDDINDFDTIIPSLLDYIIKEIDRNK